MSDFRLFCSGKCLLTTANVNNVTGWACAELGSHVNTQ